MLSWIITWNSFQYWEWIEVSTQKIGFEFYSKIWYHSVNTGLAVLVCFNFYMLVLMCLNLNVLHSQDWQLVHEPDPIFFWIVTTWGGKISLCFPEGHIPIDSKKLWSQVWTSSFLLVGTFKYGSLTRIWNKKIRGGGNSNINISGTNGPIFTNNHSKCLELKVLQI